jgi:hypothetical protein
MKKRILLGDWCIPGGALFFAKDEIPEELFPADSRAILDWKKDITEVLVH